MGDFVTHIEQTHSHTKMVLREKKEKKNENKYESTDCNKNSIVIISANGWWVMLVYKWISDNRDNRNYHWVP